MDYSKIKLTPVNWKREWILLEDIFYTFKSLGVDKTIIIPAWFRTDWASVPSICWWFGTPMWTDTLASAIFHDYVYRTHLYPRDIADQFFNELMIACWVWFFKRNLFYLWVRIWGWLTYYFTWEYVKNKKLYKNKK